MGKTVKSRVFVCITSLVCVIAICLIANTAIPSLWESYAKKVAAEEEANKPVAVQVVKPAPTAPQAPVTEPTEASEVFEIEEPAVVEPTEPVTEEPVEEETTTEPAADSGSESFLDKIINFLTSIFDLIFSGEIFTKIGDFFAGILGIFGL